MKRVLLAFGVAFALLFSACSKDRTAHIPPDNFGIYAVVEEGGTPMPHWDSSLEHVPIASTPQLTGADVAEVWEQTNEMWGKQEIFFRFTDEGAQTFADFTQAHVRERIAIVIDGRVASAPVVQERIGGGRAVIDPTPAQLPAIRAALRLPTP